MDKGITFFFGWDIEPEKRAKMISEAGFTSIMTCADKRFNRQNGTLAKQIKLFKKYNLKLSSLHARYKSSDLHYFWEEGKAGERIKKNLIKDVKLAHKYGFKCVVVHLFGKYSSIGEKRLLEVLDVCEKLNIPLAIENINKKDTFVNVFSNIKHDKLKFCFDSGHNNIFNRNFDYLKTYRENLVALHLHDNDGILDLHTITKYCDAIDYNRMAKTLVDHADWIDSVDWNRVTNFLVERKEKAENIDWDNIAKQLAKSEDISLDFEVMNRGNADVSAEEYLREVFSFATAIEKKILKYKKIKSKSK